MHVVLRHVDGVVGVELVARRLLGDAGVVALGDLGLDLPLLGVALARDDVGDLVGHVPVPGRAAAGPDLLLVHVDAEDAHVGCVLRAEHAHLAVARRLPDGVGRRHDLLALLDAVRPDLAPVLARAELLLVVDLAAAALLDQAEVHPRRLRLHHERLRGLVAVVEVPVDGVGVHDDEVARLPVVALVVVDLVALALEDVEDGLVLVAVPVVRLAGWDLDEVDLDVLRQEGLVAGADAPPRARVLGVAGMPDLRVVDDDLVVTDTRSCELRLAEFLQPVLLRAHPSQENTAFLRHSRLLSRRRLRRLTQMSYH